MTPQNSDGEKHTARVEFRLCSKQMYLWMFHAFLSTLPALLFHRHMIIIRLLRNNAELGVF